MDSDPIWRSGLARYARPDQADPWLVVVLCMCGGASTRRSDSCMVGCTLTLDPTKPWQLPMLVIVTSTGCIINMLCSLSRYINMFSKCQVCQHVCMLIPTLPTSILNLGQSMACHKYGTAVRFNDATPPIQWLGIMSRRSDAMMARPTCVCVCVCVCVRPCTCNKACRRYRHRLT
jgi:hypothetical protein